jgi:4-hydroxybenzoate polyprenyltransferase
VAVLERDEFQSGASSPLQAVDLSQPAESTSPDVAPLHGTSASSLVLISELNETVLLTNLRDESILALLCRRPWRLPRLIARRMAGKAAFDQALFADSPADMTGALVNEALFDWLLQRHTEGAAIVLLSEPPKSMSEIFGVRSVVFSVPDASAQASLGHSGDGNFTYVIGNRSDLRTRERRGSAVLVGDVARIKRALPAEVNVVAEFPILAANFRVWCRALRLHQWAKNLLIFVPLLLSGLILSQSSLMVAILAFIAFGLLASATYVINDFYDLPDDRRHHTKRHRPIASAALPLRSAALAVPVLLGLSALTMHWLRPEFQCVALVYLVATLAYSMSLKRQPILDIIVLAGLLTLRLVAGILVIGTVLSPWLLAFAMFFFAALATVKRFTECAVLQGEGYQSIHGRGYRPQDASWLMSMGAACGFASILVFCIYLVDAVPQTTNMRHAAYMWPICPIIAYWMGRIWLLASRGEMREDPIAFALRDRVSLLCGLAVALIAALAVF